MQLTPLEPAPVNMPRPVRPRGFVCGAPGRFVNGAGPCPGKFQDRRSWLMMGEQLTTPCCPSGNRGAVIRGVVGMGNGIRWMCWFR